MDEKFKATAVIGLVVGCAAFSAAIGFAVVSGTAEDDLRTELDSVSTTAEEAWVKSAEATAVVGEVTCQDGYVMSADRRFCDAIDPTTLTSALVTPCATEDSDNCYWLGGDNATGVRFVTVEGHVFPLASVLEG